MAHLAKRAWADLNRLKGLSVDSSSSVKFIIDSLPFDNEGTLTTPCIFTGRLLPMSIPFNQSALKVELKLTDKYPGKPPGLRILTPIHHPNVGEDGSVCLPILDSIESWQASMFLDDVLKALVTIIDHPDLNLPVNDNVANEYLHKKEEYDRKALQIVRKNILSRT